MILPIIEINIMTSFDMYTVTIRYIVTNGETNVNSAYEVHAFI